MFNIIFESLNKVDQKTGMIKLTTSKLLLEMNLSRKKQENPKVKKLKESEVIKAVFDYNWMMTFFELPRLKNKKIYKQIDLQLNEEADGGVSVTFNLFKYWNIPQTNTEQQLKDIISFFELGKNLLSTTSYKLDKDLVLYSGKIQVNNERVKNKTDFSILVQNKNKKTDYYELMEESTKTLKDFIKSHQTIHDLLLESAYKLNKVGRYAWINITPEQLGLHWKNS